MLQINKLQYVIPDCEVEVDLLLVFLIQVYKKVLQEIEQPFFAIYQALTSLLGNKWWFDFTHEKLTLVVSSRIQFGLKHLIHLNVRSHSFRKNSTFSLKLTCDLLFEGSSF